MAFQGVLAGHRTTRRQKSYFQRGNSSEAVWSNQSCLTSRSRSSQHKGAKMQRLNAAVRLCVRGWRSAFGKRCLLQTAKVARSCSELLHLAKLFSNAKLSSVSNDGCGKRFVHTLLTWLLAFIGSVWAADPIFLDDFNDDAGDLTGESANTGQEWAWHTADWSQGPLVVGRRYGQDGSLGAGYRQTAVEPAWRANQVAIGETIRSGS